MGLEGAEVLHLLRLLPIPSIALIAFLLSGKTAAQARDGRGRFSPEELRWVDFVVRVDKCRFCTLLLLPHVKLMVLILDD